VSEPIALRMHLQAEQVEILLLWAANESRTTWTDLPTRQAMQDFLKWIHYAVGAQCPHVKIDQEFGDFS
jgi:hypothetical protein